MCTRMELMMHCQPTIGEVIEEYKKQLAAAQEIIVAQQARIAGLVSNSQVSRCALLELSPCAYHECKQEQTETLEIAKKLAKETLQVVDNLSALHENNARVLDEAENKIISLGKSVNNEYNKNLPQLKDILETFDECAELCSGLAAEYRDKINKS